MLITKKGRQENIKWIQDDNNNSTEEMETKIDKFYILATTQWFPIIEELTVDIFNYYLEQLNTEEAVQKIEALQKNKATRLTTAEVATIFANEPSLDPV